MFRPSGWNLATTLHELAVTIGHAAPLYGSPLHPDPPGVEAGHEGSPAGGALGRSVGLGQ